MGKSYQEADINGTINESLFLLINDYLFFRNNKGEWKLAITQRRDIKIALRSSIKESEKLLTLYPQH